MSKKRSKGNKKFMFHFPIRFIRGTQTYEYHVVPDGVTFREWMEGLGFIQEQTYFWHEPVAVWAKNAHEAREKACLLNFSAPDEERK